MIYGKLEYKSDDSLNQFIDQSWNVYSKESISDIHTEIVSEVYSIERSTEVLVAAAIVIKKEDNFWITRLSKTELSYEAIELAVRMLADYLFQNGHDKVFCDGGINGRYEEQLFYNCGFVKVIDRIFVLEKKVFYTHNC